MDMDCSFEKVDEGGKLTKMDSLQGAMEEMGENSVRLPILERGTSGSETGVDCGEIEMKKGDLLLVEEWERSRLVGRRKLIPA